MPDLIVKGPFLVFKPKILVNKWNIKINSNLRFLREVLL